MASETQGFTLDLDLEGADATIRAAVVKGLTEGFKYLGEESDKITPKDSGDLIRSRRNKIDPNTLSGEISYTDEIAQIVHEDLTAKHSDGRTAKFLERTMNGHGKDALRIVFETVRAEIGE